MRWTIVVALLGGCAIGGYSTVGPLRAHDRTDYRVCLDASESTCEAHRDVVTRVPQRSFWGIAVAAPIGRSLVDVGRGVEKTGRIEPCVELLRGRGAFAVGVRLSYAHDTIEATQTGTLRSYATLPITVLVHWGVTDWFEVFGGAGISPYNHVFEHGVMEDTSVIGVRGLLGAKVTIHHGRWVNPYLGAQLDTSVSHFETTYRASALAFSIGFDIR